MSKSTACSIVQNFSASQLYMLSGVCCKQNTQDFHQVHSSHNFNYHKEDLIIAPLPDNEVMTKHQCM